VKLLNKSFGSVPVKEFRPTFSTMSELHEKNTSGNDPDSELLCSFTISRFVSTEYASGTVPEMWFP
jgi:hypothetical protein